MNTSTKWLVSVALCFVGFNQATATEEFEPADVFVGSVTSKSTRYIYQGKEITRDRAEELYVEYLEREPTYEKEWDPDSGQPPPKEVWDEKSFELPIKYRVTVAVESGIQGSIKKDDTIDVTWESSYRCYCTRLESIGLEGGRFLWTTNPDSSKKRARFMPHRLGSDYAKSWLKQKN
ncbi:hypothetical protein [Pelagicoccus sp. SDUM812005]|uniref:hypothetical protein n=1 Tax=Pelagicoccus sp. SDUM812005 TaxID=3041257 RepID=UPI00280C4981|nr:hypothetical protein [Pelagicoccus sp. SDUM812005]MDQ8181392.1 hypothetical protein [Pelagicoccus sp. SDUM812005]